MKQYFLSDAERQLLKDCGENLQHIIAKGSNFQEALRTIANSPCILKPLSHWYGQAFAESLLAKTPGVLGAARHYKGATANELRKLSDEIWKHGIYSAAFIRGGDQLLFATSSSLKDLKEFITEIRVSLRRQNIVYREVKLR